MWKRVVFALFLVLLTTIALCPKQLLTFAAKKITIAYFQNNFGTTLQLSHVKWENGAITFVEGTIQKPHYFAATFDHASYTPYVNLKTKEIGGTFHINDLEVLHQRVEPLTPPSTKKAKTPYFSPNFTLLVRDCHLRFTDGKKPITLDLTHHYKGGQQTGNVVLYSEQKPLDFLFSTTSTHLEIATNFQHHLVAPLQELLTTFFGSYLPSHFIDWHVLDGTINGHLSAQIEEATLQRLVGSIQLEKPMAHNEPLSVLAAANGCSIEFEMEQARLPNWSGTLELHEGRLGLEEEAWHSLGEIRGVNTTLRVCEGQLDSTTFCGTILGLEGEVAFDWQKDDNLMQLSCFGSGEKVLPLLPQCLSVGFKETIGKEDLQLNAALHRGGEGLVLEGAVTLSSEHTLEFGCQFGGRGELPVSLKKEPFISGLLEQFCLSEKRLGHFRAKGLPLQKFLAPFIVKDLPFTIGGVADIEGTFDERYIVLFHKCRDFAFSGESFALTVPQSVEQGVHYIDLLAKEHVGYMPVTKGKYIQHSCKDLTLEDVSGTIHFENNVIDIRGVENVWHGLPLEAEVNLTIHSKDDVDLYLGASCKRGSLLAGKRLLSHFTDSPLDQLPVRGTFSIEPGDLGFWFHLDPSVSVTRGIVKGESYFSLDALGLGFEKGKTEFVYDRESFQLKDFNLETKVAGKQWGVDSLSFSQKDGELELKGALLYDGTHFSDLRGELKKDLFSFSAGPLQLQGKHTQEGTFVEEIEWGEGRGSGHLDKDHHIALTLAHPKMGRCEFSGEKNQGKMVVEALNIEELTGAAFGDWEFKGTFSGEGNVCFNKESGFAIKMTGEHRNLSFGSLRFGNGDKLSLTYNQETGLKLEGLEALGEYKLGALHYDPKLSHVYFEGFDFTISSKNFPDLALTAERLFPGKISPKMFEVLSEVKQEEPLCGRLWIDLDPKSIWVHLKLDDGTYFFEGQPWEINQFALTYDPNLVEIQTGLLVQNVPSQLKLTADSKSLSQGKIVLQEERAEDFLAIDWVLDPTCGYQIERAFGLYAGLGCDLSRRQGGDRERFHLGGKINCYPGKALSLLPKGLSEVMHRLKFGGEYQLEGEFTLPKQDLVHPTFQGTLTGRDCTIVETKLASLSCQCSASEKEVLVNNVAIQDWAGNIFCDQILFCKDDYWQVHADHIAIRDFRPSRLDSRYTKRERGDKSPFRTLFISACELSGFRGYLTSKESFVGSGQLSFTNLSRRTFFSNLMMIPTEITARIGLDLTNFIPARGTIHYTLADGRLYLNEFQDVYSDAKRSRFYLADQTENYVMLNGDCHLNIRMKQYNLLMKLAELFTVTVKGSVLDPQYVFTSQSVD